MAKVGRPSKYTQAIADEICRRLSNGESLREICRDEHIPDKETIRKWKSDFPQFLAQYAKAREEQVDHYADEILEIAHDGRNDWLERQNARSGETYAAFNSEAVMRSRLRVDTLKWIMSKIVPKKYGDKIEHEVNGNLDVKVTIGGNAKPAH